ncbi:DUF4191 domain-containing protein [Frankia sp. AgB1.9]|uniref:DUF4191 domain-containing protein n=1 Tax=unclassified Frankia TaxID=2632575 RepID=UPI001933DEE3|nr:MULTISPECIES: DUF4191 domain-containing protein [unclassified Frankia]MBL7493370.1 DUF4191 domain-containing protein [Frankia sp. AgW1.1]MBL7553587.1 DUF4191 domain-containing protein [Frankia sp. AgB1.9]MBL7621544.1 DUF4191 domain-containing protein [Frankia sp. AgB1.8]
MALRKKPTGAAPAPASPTARGAKGPTSNGAGPGNQADGETGFANRMRQIRLVFKVTRERDSKLVPILLGGFLAPFAVLLVLGFLIGPIWLWAPFAVLLGLLVAVNLFSRRVQNSAYAELEGKPGAAAGIVERMRGDWRLTPAVQVNRNQDVAHRVVGRAGIIIIAEGRGRGARELLATEIRRIRKVAGDVPITDIVVGTGEGEVPLPKLQPTLMRMRRTLKRGEVDQLDRRLKAVAGSGPSLPIPKGPVPRNVPRGKIR